MYCDVEDTTEAEPGPVPGGTYCRDHRRSALLSHSALVSKLRRHRALRRGQAPAPLQELVVTVRAIALGTSPGATSSIRFRACPCAPCCATRLRGSTRRARVPPVESRVASTFFVSVRSSRTP